MSAVPCVGGGCYETPGTGGTVTRRRQERGALAARQVPNAYLLTRRFVSGSVVFFILLLARLAPQASSGCLTLFLATAFFCHF